MKSPLDPKATLERFDLEPGLTAFRCPSTGGVWIDGDAYHRWVQASQCTPHADAPAPDPRSVQDTRRALLSPRSGRLLTKYHVGHGVGFLIDYDGATGGFWLDPGEFDRLKSLGLHDELHLITDDHYQAQLRRAEAAAKREDRFKSLLGPEYERARQVRAWLEAHLGRAVLLAYLTERPER